MHNQSPAITAYKHVEISDDNVIATRWLWSLFALQRDDDAFVKSWKFTLLLRCVVVNFYESREAEQMNSKYSRYKITEPLYYLLLVNMTKQHKTFGNKFDVSICKYTVRQSNYFNFSSLCLNVTVKRFWHLIDVLDSFICKLSDLLNIVTNQQ